MSGFCHDYARRCARPRVLIKKEERARSSVSCDAGCIMYSTVGLVIGIGAIALFLAAFSRRGRSRDLGTVSRTWIVENRTDHGGYRD
jgi:hypothetical protein